MQAEREGGWEAFDARVGREMVEARLEGPHQRRWFIERAYARMPLEREADKLARQYQRQLRLSDAR